MEHGRPGPERRKCDLINLGSLSLQLPYLSGSPLDAADLNSESAHGILSSISKLIRRPVITTTDDRFTDNHRSCYIGTGLVYDANNIIDSTDGIELEAVASGAPPEESRQLSQLSELLKPYQLSRNPPSFEVVMRLTAVPSNTDFWREITTRSPTTSDTSFAWCPKIKCNHCPGFEYSLFQHQNDEVLIDKALKRHLTSPLHYERVKRSLEAALAT